MQVKKEVTQEFQKLYDEIDSMTTELAVEILKLVSKNEERVLKKIKIRLENVITEIKEIK